MLGSVAVMGAAFMSCSKDVAFDSEGVEKAAAEQLKAEYEANFVKKYGAIDPNQTWDFASMKATYSLPSTGNAARTRGGAVTVNGGKNGDMTIEKTVLDWMHTNMKAGDNNTKKGSPFYMVSQENSFTIVPIYQGQAGYYWELWMNIGGIETQIWKKGDIKYRTSKNSNTWLTPGGTGVPSDAYEVKAPKFTYTATKDAQMYFFLKVWTNGTGRGVSNYRLTSLDHMMLALGGIDKPAQVPTDNDVIIIGCEDNPVEDSSDNDYEDLVFMMYGKPAPPVNHVDEVDVSQTKRYMMEDLGATDDFDFNDIVVDVSNIYKKKVYYHYDNNHALVFDREEEIPGTRHQEAIVRAAGGTLEFTLEIGTNTITQWSKTPTYTATDMLNTGWNGTDIYYSGAESVLAKFAIEDNDWDPATNNIKVIVKGRGENDGVKTITFPRKGSAPMIIAVDPTNEWMPERRSVPYSWIKTDE